jgi:Resolvase, N terminal domain
MKAPGSPLERTTTKGGQRKENVMLSKRNRQEKDRRAPRKMRTAIYLRESTDDERNRPGGDLSVEQQRLLCRYKATQLWAEVTDEFVDDRHSSQSGLAQVMARAQRLDYLIVSSLDRLVGDRDDAFDIAWRLGFAATIVFSVEVSYEFPWPEDTPPS